MLKDLLHIYADLFSVATFQPRPDHRTARAAAANAPQPPAPRDGRPSGQNGEEDGAGEGPATAAGRGRKVLALSSSPRRYGNSRRLAEAILEGAAEAGAKVDLVHLPDHVHGMLRDCRQCRGADGRCAIADGYEVLFLEKFLPADAVVYATPLWWYGMSGHLKSFIDRIFCYVAHSYPDSEGVVRRLAGKRAALALSAEESYFGARLAVAQQMQEYCRYLHHSFVGIVTGIGNRRGEVRDDPTDPLAMSRALGRRLFEIRMTDYRIDTDRPGAVWHGDADVLPAHWR